MRRSLILAGCAVFGCSARQPALTTAVEEEKTPIVQEPEPPSSVKNAEVLLEQIGSMTATTEESRQDLEELRARLRFTPDSTAAGPMSAPDSTTTP